MHIVIHYSARRSLSEKYIVILTHMCRTLWVLCYKQSHICHILHHTVRPHPVTGVSPAVTHMAHTALHCHTVQHPASQSNTVTHCIILPYVILSLMCHTLSHIPCNTLSLMCHTLSHIASHYHTSYCHSCVTHCHTYHTIHCHSCVTHCHTLSYTVMKSNILQHTLNTQTDSHILHHVAIQCNILPHNTHICHTLWSFASRNHTTWWHTRHTQMPQPITYWCTLPHIVTHIHTH